MEEEGTLRGKEKRHSMREGKTQGRDVNFVIRVVILQGENVLCLSAQPGGAERQRGLAAIAFHWQADKRGAAWRQEGHYQRLGQTEIRASFGPGRQASTHTDTNTQISYTLETSPWKDCKAGDESLCTLEMSIVKC